MAELRQIAALYVDPRGSYPKMPGVDPLTEGVIMPKKTKPCAEAFIERGVITIRLPVSHLPMAVEHWPLGVDARVTDAAVFATSVVSALNCEEENGSTPIHHLFDAACEKALDDGADGIEVLSTTRK